MNRSITTGLFAMLVVCFVTVTTPEPASGAVAPDGAAAAWAATSAEFGTHAVVGIPRLAVATECIEVPLDADGDTDAVCVVDHNFQGLQGHPVVIAIAVGVASSVIASWLYDLLDREPGWYRIARQSCFYKARRLGWAVWGVEIEYDTDGNVLEWNCVERGAS